MCDSNESQAVCLTCLVVTSGQLDKILIAITLHTLNSLI